MFDPTAVALAVRPAWLFPDELEDTAPLRPAHRDARAVSEYRARRPVRIQNSDDAIEVDDGGSVNARETHRIESRFEPADRLAEPMGSVARM